ncbi:MAG: phage tail protein I [Novosphingobium sp.]|nr:phage tail protein I [Novosphingobium sp.]
MTELLPPNATAFERAFEAMAVSRYPRPSELIAHARDPDLCPAELLEWLAWELSIDIWDATWPEAKKRSILRNAMTLHRLKTTLAGIRAWVALVDAEVVGVVRPPAREHMRASLTDEQREAWLDSLPQVRIYPYFKRAEARGGHAFLSRPSARRYISAAGPLADIGIKDENGLPLMGSGLPGTPLPRRFLFASRGYDIYRRKAVWVDNGAETEADLTLADDGVVERVSIRRQAGPRRFIGHGWMTGHMLAGRADSALLTIRIGDDAPSLAVSPGAQPVDIRPRRVSIRRTAQAGRAFAGRAWASPAAPHMIRSAGPLLIYDRIAFAVPGRSLPRVKATAFAGHGRFGIAPFTAELRIRKTMQRPRALQNRFVGHGWMHQADMTPFWRVLEAVRVSKAHRDTVLVTTTTMQRASFNSSLRFGDFDFGDMRKVA